MLQIIESTCYKMNALLSLNIFYEMLNNVFQNIIFIINFVLNEKYHLWLNTMYIYVFYRHENPFTQPFYKNNFELVTLW